MSDDLVILSPAEKLKRKLFGKPKPRESKVFEEVRRPMPSPEDSPELIGLKAANFDLLRDVERLKAEKEQLEVRFNEMAAEIVNKEERLSYLQSSRVEQEKAARELMEQFMDMLATLKRKRGRKKKEEV